VSKAGASPATTGDVNAPATTSTTGGTANGNAPATTTTVDPNAPSTTGGATTTATVPESAGIYTVFASLSLSSHVLPVSLSYHNRHCFCCCRACRRRSVLSSRRRSVLSSIIIENNSRYVCSCGFIIF
jgi:hypothetical protein